MLTTINSGHWKIMRLFYEDKNASIHLREISRRTKIHLPSTVKTLTKLVKDSVLIERKVGNLKIFSVNQTQHTYWMFTAFDLVRYKKIPSVRRRAIETYLDELPEKPVFVVLFGSTATGRHRGDSDIDLLIVPNRRISSTQAEEAAHAVTAQHIQTFQMTLNKFVKEVKLKEDHVVQSALHNGFPIWNQIQFYDCVYGHTP